jgi:hypothetical protein
MSELDDEFKAKALAAEKAERERAASKGSGGFDKHYELIKYTGLVPSVMKVIRALGSEPNFSMDDSRSYLMNNKSNQFDARVVRIASVLDDKQKRMRLILPFVCLNSKYILHRMFADVNEYEWVDKKRVFTNKNKNPLIYNIINYNNLPEDNISRKFGLEGYGWLGREMFILNCIDRSMNEWHFKNKHSVILSKNINTKVNLETGKEIEYPEEGVPAYGFTSKIQIGLTKYYGSWENFDIGIERTGMQSDPYRCINASKNIEQVPDKLQSLVVNGPLTEEELNYKRYDLDKLFGVTSYSRVYNKLHLTISMVDEALGTKYLEELRSLSEDEKARMRLLGKEIDPEEALDESNTKAQVVKSEDLNSEIVKKETTVSKTETTVKESLDKITLGVPTTIVINDDDDVRPVRTKPSDLGSSVVLVTDLPAYSKLEADEIKVIDSVSKNEKGDYVVKYNITDKLWKCPDCNTRAPKFFKTCPGCGLYLGSF